MSEGGKFFQATRETAEAVGFYNNMRKLIPAIRAARIQVVIVPHHRWREGDYVGWKHVNPTQVVSNQAQAFAAGSERLVFAWHSAPLLPMSCRW